jgi:HPt (histidine-containing phosphotransfer) domain-containing protein
VLERWVPASPGAGSGVKDLDWSALRRIQDLWGEQGLAFLRELVGIYLKDAPVRVARLDEALTSRDRVALHDAAHAFKSSNASLGLRVLASLCVEIEEGAGHLPWDALSRLVAGVPGAFARARAALTAATGEPPLAESGPPL